jgi:hypothetical protein
MSAVGGTLPIVEEKEHRWALGNGAQQIAELA